MVQESWVHVVQQQRAIAVIRAPHLEAGLAMARAVAAAGMRLIEITWNSEKAAQIVSRLRVELPDCRIGAGTLLTLEQLQEAIDAGAQFCFTPHTNPTLIQYACDRQMPIVPGALSPSEIVAAWQAGATCVKVFPVQAVGGASYIRAIRSPLGCIPLIPTGGVTLENARTFIAAGAFAIGLSSELFPEVAIVRQDWATVTERAGRLMHHLHTVVP